MRRHREIKSDRGFTLLELLCVIAIIVVLASLFLGPAARILQRVLADKWAEQAEVSLRSTVEQLNQRYQGEQSFPVVTLERIEAEGLLKPAEVLFLKDPRVTFIPFAGSDSDDRIVIRVKLKHGFWTDSTELIEHKEAITRVPK